LAEGLKAEGARLVEQAQFEGVQLTGEGGLLPDMIKQAVEAALQGEMTAHLGYERYAPEGRGSGNSRNGSTAKTVQTAAGAAEVSVPRDRAGSFEPIRCRRAPGVTEFDDMVIRLYAKGLTTRDIAEWLAQTYGAKISHETVANITDSVTELVKTWRSRPLDEVYPILYIDAIRVRVRDGGAVRIKACHLAIGVDLEGRKRVLGLWIEQHEGARFWLSVLTELRNRGMRDVLIVCCDGLTGLPEVIGQIWPQAIVQTSSINTGRWRDGLAGHRATGRGPMQARAFEALMQTCSSWWRRVA
jgi:putative transposase